MEAYHHQHDKTVLFDEEDINNDTAHANVFVQTDGMPKLKMVALESSGMNVLLCRFFELVVEKCSQVN